MDDGTALGPKIFLIVILILINAFFAAIEMATVSASKAKLREKAEDGDKGAKILLELTDDQTRFLSTIQIIITLAGFFASGLCAISISKILGFKLSLYGIYHSEKISFVIVTIILSYISLVFGELVPKRIALNNSEFIAVKYSGFLKIISIIFYPFVKIISLSTVVILKILGKYSEDVEEKISEEELKSYIKVSQEAGVINSAGEEMIVNIMDFDDKMAYEIMTPRTSIYMIDIDEFSVDMIDEILKRGFSRIPVYRDDTDNIIGTLYIKDLFIEYAKNDYKFVDIEKTLKTPYFIPETKKVDILLKELQATKNYVAILIDEYGGFSGMVTVEDIVEEIVGEIEDEYDKDLEKMEKMSDDEYVVDGLCDIEDVNDFLNINLYSEDHETISGYFIEKLGYIPDENSTKNLKITSQGVTLTGLGVKDKRIVKIRIKILNNNI